MKDHNLRITEIFFSLQGETTFAGLPTVFIRLTGCPLRCQYCDTAYAFKGGEMQSIDDILSTVAEYSTTYVTVTGGEPLAQKPCINLLEHLCEAGYTVSLETSGALSVQDVDDRVVKILDIKTPGSQECHRNLFENFNYLNDNDQIKFVICDRNDYEWSREAIVTNDLIGNFEILFSPSYKELELSSLADWILQDQLKVRLQTQMHKYIWGDVPGK